MFPHLRTSVLEDLKQKELRCDHVSKNTYLGTRDHKAIEIKASAFQPCWLRRDTTNSLFWHTSCARAEVAGGSPLVLPHSLWSYIVPGCFPLFPFDGIPMF